MTASVSTSSHETFLIDPQLLLESGAAFKEYRKDEYVFREGQRPRFYHQVHQGRVKMCNNSEEGREFIQGFFGPGQSFGEPPLFLKITYPSSAVATENCVILRLQMESLWQLLKNNFEVHYRITSRLAQRLVHKNNILKEISCHTPEHRILSILNTYKKEHEPAPGDRKIKIDFTRQEIACMSGLRVETVIRAMRQLHNDQVIVIEKGKVYY